MRSYCLVTVFVLLSLSGSVLGQTPSPAALVPEVLFSDDMAAMNGALNSILSTEDSLPPRLTPPVVLPVMSPELAYSAPKSLLFTALHFTGDTFVKANVIARLMQSEVEHAQKDDSSSMAFTAANYKFSYKGLQSVGGRTLHEFQLKPRRRRVGLLKGNLYLDAYTGSLVHLEGAPAKSPSVFLSKIRVSQDFADFGPFTLPVHLHSEAKASIVGRTIVDVYQRDYQVMTAATQTARAAGTE